MEKLCGKATKKPVEINWFKWRGYSESHIHELEAWLESFKWKTGDNVKFLDVIEMNKSNSTISIKTLEGTSYNLPAGYIIIRGVEGEFYPCEAEIFNKTYNIL